MKDGRAIAMSTDPNVSNDVCTFCKSATFGGVTEILDAPTCAKGFTPYFRSLSNLGPIWVSDCQSGELRDSFKETSAMNSAATTGLCSCKASQRDGQHMAWCSAMTDTGLPTDEARALAEKIEHSDASCFMLDQMQKEIVIAALRRLAPVTGRDREAVAWPTEDQIWESIRLTFDEKTIARLSFKRWKDGIDIDIPSAEAVLFAKQMFAIGAASDHSNLPTKTEITLSLSDDGNSLKVTDPEKIKAIADIIDGTALSQPAETPRKAVVSVCCYCDADLSCAKCGREQPAETPEPETKLVYIKRWRTIVPLPKQYADEIIEALRAETPAAIAEMRLEARPADDSQEWTEIFPAQLEWAAKQGNQVRAIELSTLPAPMRKSNLACVICDSPAVNNNGYCNNCKDLADLPLTSAPVPAGMREALEILPCPFCGGEAVSRMEVDGLPMIYCDGDECMGPQTTAGNLQDAIVQWNTRAELHGAKEYLRGYAIGLHDGSLALPAGRVP